MEEKKMQDLENEAKQLGDEQLESVAGGRDLKEWACVMSNKHKLQTDESSAFELIGSDGAHTIYYYKECKACGTKHYMKYNCSAGKSSEISMSEFMLAKQLFTPQSY